MNRGVSIAIVAIVAAIMVGGTVLLYLAPGPTVSAQSSGPASSSGASVTAQASPTSTGSVSTGNLQTRTGSLSFYLADAPSSPPSLKYLLVNVSALVLRYYGNVSATGRSNEYVFGVSSETGTNVNLTSLQGKVLLLGAAQVPAGKIAALTFNITGARAFFSDQTSVRLKVVANGELTVPFQFQVNSGGSTDLTIEMRPSLVHISGGYVLTPVIHVTSVEKHDTTTITRSTETTALTTGENVTTTSSVSVTTTAASTTAVSVIIPQGVGNDLSLNFEPATIRIVIGVNNTVVWTNSDVVPHTVTAGSIPAGAQPFDSGTMHNGDTFQVTFAVAGTYTYHCNLHPSWMKGTIIVLTAP